MSANWIVDQMENSRDFRSRRMQREHRQRLYIYFIGSENGPIKIGKAKNVKNRLKELQTSNPEKLEIIGVMIGRAELEKSLHAKFAAHRLNGEWFQRCDEILRFIDENSLEYGDGLRAKASDEVSLLKERIASLEKELLKKSKQLESAARTHIFKEFENVLVQEQERVFEYNIRIARRMAETVEGVERTISKYDVCWNGRDAVFDEVRTMLRKNLGCDWREAERLMFTQRDQDDSKKVEAFARKSVRENAWRLGVIESEISRFK